MKIKIGGKYFFNNGLVEVLKFETDDFVLVKGYKKIHTEIRGSNFCTECQVGGMGITPQTHKCDDAQEIIDEVIDDISYEDVFWVNVRHLQEKPFEYKKWEKITEDNKLLSEKTNVLRNTKETLEESVKSLKEQSESELKNIEELKAKKENLINELSSIEKKKIVLDNVPNIKITNSNIVIKTKDLLGYIKDSIILNKLENGGVDNWEWYSESLHTDIPKDCEDKDDYFENKALEILSSFIK